MLALCNVMLYNAFCACNLHMIMNKGVSFVKSRVSAVKFRSSPPFSPQNKRSWGPIAQLVRAHD